MISTLASPTGRTAPYYVFGSSSFSRLTECVPGVTYYTVAPTTFADRVCDHVTNCTLRRTFQTAIPTAIADRACGGNCSACSRSRR